jgi:hypothetical protein
MADEPTCKVCGLRAEQIPPQWRFVKADKPDDLCCSHPFGVPATNVPIWTEE